MDAQSTAQTIEEKVELTPEEIAKAKAERKALVKQRLAKGEEELDFFLEVAEEHLPSILKKLTQVFALSFKTTRPIVAELIRDLQEEPNAEMEAIEVKRLSRHAKRQFETYTAYIDAGFSERQAWDLLNRY